MIIFAFGSDTGAAAADGDCSGVLPDDQPSSLINPHSVSIDVTLVHITTDLLLPVLPPKEPPLISHNDLPGVSETVCRLTRGRLMLGGGGNTRWGSAVQLMETLRLVLGTKEVSRPPKPACRPPGGSCPNSSAVP